MKTQKKRFEHPIVPHLWFNAGVRYAIAATIKYLYSYVDMPQHPIQLASFINKRDTVIKHREIINNFRDTVLVNVKRIHQITEDHVDAYFDILINNGVKRGAIITHADALKNFFYLLSKSDLAAHIDNNIPEWLCRVNISANKAQNGGDI